VIWLRYQRPDLPRHFKVPLFPLLPIAGVLACFVLAYIGVEAKIRWFFFWFIAGAIAVYFLYGFWVSPLRNKPAEGKA
jgi:APA family basic amino acid/polyamine antiporter